MDYTKEGQVGGSVGAIIQLIVGVGIATLVLIFVGTLGGQTYNLVESNIEEIGERFYGNATTFTALNNSVANDLGHMNIHTGTLAIYNNSNGADATSQFTIDYDLGTATMKTSAPIAYNNTAFKATYYYGMREIQDSVKNGVISSFSAIEQTGNYLPIIVLAVVIALVMGLVMGLGGIQGGNSGSAL